MVSDLLGNDRHGLLAEDAFGCWEIPLFQSELADGVALEMGDGFLWVIGKEDQFGVFGADGASLGHLIDEVHERLPVVLAHEDDGEVAEFAALNQGHGFEHFVHGSSTAGEDDEGVGVFDEDGLPREEVVHVD